MTAPVGAFRVIASVGAAVSIRTAFVVASETALPTLSVPVSVPKVVESGPVAASVTVLRSLKLPAALPF